MHSASKEQSPEVRDARRKRVKYLMRFISAACIASAALFAASNLERTPITNRLRVITGTFEEDVAEVRPVTDAQLVEANKHLMLPDSHPLFMRIHEVVSRLVETASDQQLLSSLGVPSLDFVCKNASATDWRLAVIDKKNEANAFVSPDGTIFVMTGLFSSLADEKNGSY
jgi:Zn-dependent protease with chaperone function